MSKVIQQNPDGSILIEEDSGGNPMQVNLQTGVLEPAAAPTGPPRRFLLRRNLERGTFDVEDVPTTPPVAPVEAPINLADYAVPNAASAVEQSLLPSAPQMRAVAQKTESLTTPNERAGVDARMETGAQQQLSGATKAAEAAGEKAAAEAAVMATGLEAEEKRLSLEMQKQRIREERVNAAGAQLQDTLDNLAKTTFDPNRFYARMDTGSQIAAGLAMGLGAVGQALMGLSENPAMTAINRAIERDIDAQKTDLDKKKGMATIAGSIYSQMRDQFADERSATEATRAAMLKTVDMKLQKIAATSKNQEVAANAMTMSGKINEDIAKTTAAVLKELNDKITVESQTGGVVDIHKTRTEIWDTVKSNPQIKDYAESREGLRQFEIARKSGTLGVGLVSFIAKGLKQGSFNDGMLKILDWGSIPQDIDTEIRKRLGNSTDSVFAKKLSTFLVAQEASMRMDLGGVFDNLDRQAKAVGEQGLSSFMALGPVGSNSPLGKQLQGRKRVGETTKR